MSAALPAAISGYITKQRTGEQVATVCGFEVLYVYEAPDYSVGIGPAWYIQAVKVGGEWLSAVDAFRDDFIDKLREALPDAVRDDYEATLELEP